jgi:cobaltochelatase CobN
VAGNIDRQLKGNDVIVHSRTTFVYGVLDNDDFYQFAGGLNSASKLVNDGTPPQLYVNNLRARGRERVENFRNFLVTELSGRLWNPKWIKAQQEAGYASARQFVKEMEHLYGWQATSKEHVDEELWQRNFDVYVADKHGLKMDEFFAKENPHAQQWVLTRLLEIDRQGTHKFSEQDRELMVRKYVENVNRNGAACHANSCGNLRLHQYVAGVAGNVRGIGNLALQQFAATMSKSTHWTEKDFPQAPAAVREGLRKAARARANASEPMPAAPPSQKQNPAAAKPYVSGLRLVEKNLTPRSTNAGKAMPLETVTLLALGAMVAMGLLWECRKGWIG